MSVMTTNPEQQQGKAQEFLPHTHVILGISDSSPRPNRLRLTAPGQPPVVPVTPVVPTTAQVVEDLNICIQQQIT